MLEGRSSKPKSARKALIGKGRLGLSQLFFWSTLVTRQITRLLITRP